MTYMPINTELFEPKVTFEYSKVVAKKSIFTFIDLFAGIGGFRIAISLL